MNLGQSYKKEYPPWIVGELCSVRGVCSLCHLACWVYILLLIMRRQQTTTRKKRHGEPEQIKRDLLLFRWKKHKKEVELSCEVFTFDSARLLFWTFCVSPSYTLSVKSDNLKNETNFFCFVLSFSHLIRSKNSRLLIKLNISLFIH